jgi:Ca2+-binding EF-hand superfamily protein
VRRALRQRDVGAVFTSNRISLMKTTPSLVVALGLTALCACQTNKNLQPAQSANASQSGGFDLADANHDGKLSKDEMSDFLVNEIFTARDANHDGKMTLEEWSAGDTKRAAEFRARDKDHDKVISREEALAYGRAHGVAKDTLRAADKNGDGFVDRAEMDAHYKKHEG